MLEWIDTISQKRKFLYAREEKLEQVLQMITKVSQDLEAGENMVGQAKNNIKNLDKRITKVQNPSTHLSDVFYTHSLDISYITFVTTIRFAIAIVQAQTL